MRKKYLPGLFVRFLALFTLLLGSPLFADQESDYSPVLKDTPAKTLDENVAYFNSSLKLSPSQKKVVRTALSNEQSAQLEDQTLFHSKFDRKTEKALADNQAKRWEKTSLSIATAFSGQQAQDFQNISDQIGNYLDSTYSLVVRLGLTYPQAEKIEELFRTLPPPPKKEDKKVGDNQQSANRDFSGMREKYQKIEKSVIKLLSPGQLKAYGRIQEARRAIMIQRMKDRAKNGNGQDQAPGGQLPPQNR